MAETFSHEMEQELISMRKELLDKLTEDNVDFRDMVNSMGIKDSIDVAADDIAFKKMEAINKHEASRLKAIENALARIHNGRYGLCLKCGKKIPEQRLRAIPYAVLCFECKNAEEIPGHR
ncbi:DnaK suppressor protein [Sphaerochaeta pleomorpha str. Grapes]|uniref:DnaK suppressor protein n=1 Tax=Sphaerochaeta pleomorpha (strain ATCC BAA-1885 / DSM 22778 / Grapes) TaxID=158190 RepID=G8QS90_SPHPG|nr:DnaK suppressor protein [Sphaerochaeta pleomorpha str. Grapes]